MTDYDQFTAWKDQGYNWIPIVDEIIGDLFTPLRLYLKLGRQPNSYLLESGYNGESWGRYSIIGRNHYAKILIKNHHIIHIKENDIIKDEREADPLAYLELILNSFKVPNINSLPRFAGGFVGYFGYDTIRYIEPRLNNFSANDPLDIPDIYLILSDEIIIYDNLTNKIHIIVYVDPKSKDAFDKAQLKINQIKKQLNSCDDFQLQHSTQLIKQFTSNTSWEKFQQGVNIAREYFQAGDAMQLILSQRFSRPFESDPLNLYRTLRHLNPSPYMYYLKLDDFDIVGASPEILVRLEQGQIVVRPLAGTRPRGDTIEKDKKLEKELLSDTKEIAEHLMLIDLGRNDIGRVSKIGSVKVTEKMVIERFSHVMHISSTVEGRIKQNISMIDVIRATFPAGTVSGAPKIRAMEIIDELEEDTRGLYGGAIGYLGWNGNLDLALALRTAIIKNKIIHVQTGAGLVADSNPQSEWQECLNKAKALFLATQLVEQNFLELEHDIND